MLFEFMELRQLTEETAFTQVLSQRTKSISQIITKKACKKHRQHTYKPQQPVVLRVRRQKD